MPAAVVAPWQSCPVHPIAADGDGGTQARPCSVTSLRAFRHLHRKRDGTNTLTELYPIGPNISGGVERSTSSSPQLMANPDINGRIIAFQYQRGTGSERIAAVAWVQRRTSSNATAAAVAGGVYWQTANVRLQLDGRLGPRRHRFRPRRITGSRLGLPRLQRQEGQPAHRAVPRLWQPAGTPRELMPQTATAIQPAPAQPRGGQRTANCSAIDPRPVATGAACLG